MRPSRQLKNRAVIQAEIRSLAFHLQAKQLQGQANNSLTASRKTIASTDVRNAPKSYLVQQK